MMETPLDEAKEQATGQGDADDKLIVALDDDELVIRLNLWGKQSRQHSSTWRDEARKDYDLVAGDQWDEKDKVALIEQMRQPIVFNRSAPMVDAVCGAEILNRQDVHFVPRSVGRVQTAELFNAADDWARAQCDAEDEESDAFSDAVICGMGWTETYMSYDETPEGNIIISRVDPLEMWWDPNAKKRNLTDRRYQSRKRGFDKDEFKSRWPTKWDQVLSADSDGSSAGDESMGVDFRPPYDKYRDDSGVDANSGPSKLTYVTHWQWWDMEPCYTVEQPPNPSAPAGGVKHMGVDDYKQAVMQSLMMGMPPPKATKAKRKAYFEAFVTGNVVLEKRKLECDGFTIHCVTGKRDRNKNTWYGIVRAMRDPQRWANKWLSQILHIINSNAKGGLIYEAGAFANPTKAMDEWSRPDSMTEVKAGYMQKIMPKPPATFPAGHEKLLEFATTSMTQVTGINLEMLGLVEREQAGVLEQQRKRSGYAILATFFDSLRRYRKLQGRTMAHYIQEYISDGRLIKIKGEDGYEQYVPLMRQPDAITYDIIVDEAPMSQNQKDMVWGMLMQMMPMLKDAAIPPDVWAELIKYSPLPSTIAGKIGQAMSHQDPAQQQAAQKAAELEMQGKAAIVEKDKSAAVLNYARAGKEQQPELPNSPVEATPLDHANAMAAMIKAHSGAVKDHAAADVSRAQARKAHTEADLLPFQAAVQAKAAEQPKAPPSA